MRRSEPRSPARRGCNHACSAPEHGEATCTDGSCGFECAPGYYAVVGTCEPRLAPRPIAPLSTATATSRRPTFRWELAPRNDGARIEICADRACTAVLQTVDASGTSGRPPADLPTGVVFWRLFGRQGTDVGATASPTWQLYIGARSADVDTSWGTTLDVNGDGFADVLVGSPIAEAEAGRAYLYLGAASGLSPSPVVLSHGIGWFGYTVARAGDVDGDGYADVIIGAEYGRDGDRRAYLYHGGASGLSSAPVVLDGPGGDELGGAVAGVGDVDRDGYGDVIVGASQAVSGAGRAYLYRGGPGGLTSSPLVLDNGADDGGFGASVAGAGDVNGDGYADVIIGASSAASEAGRAYIYHGGPGGLSSSPTVLDNGADGGRFGFSVASAGDVDGDGYADVVIGAAESGRTRVYLYRGESEGVSSSWVLLHDSTEGTSSSVAVAVASAGDVDRDGYADIIIGMPYADSFAGRAYLYLGGPGGPLSPALELDNGAEGGRFGRSLAGAGDVDADGYGDFIIGAEEAGSADDSSYGPGGRAYFFRGNGSGLLGTPVVLDNGDDGPLFGRSVARLELRHGLPASHVLIIREGRCHATDPHEWRWWSARGLSPT